VRWPLVAKLGLALAVLTVVGAVVAALVAAFVVDRDDEGPELEQSALVALVEVEPIG
jgi:uncharacterized membrane protein YbjE (DUF340 family)